MKFNFSEITLWHVMKHDGDKGKGKVHPRKDTESPEREQMYRVSIKRFPDYKHLLQENYVEYKHTFLPLLKLVSKILQTRWRTSTLRFTRSSVLGCNISKQVDWERWSNTLATTIAGYHHP